MALELRDGLPGAFLSAMVAATRDSQPTLTSASDLAASARGAPLAQSVVATLALGRPVGAVRTAEVEDAISSALRATGTAHLRELEGYLAVEAPTERKATMARMRTALDRVDLAAMSSTIARGGDIVLHRSRPIPLSLDEDVR